MDGRSLSAQELFWLAQEELDGNDNFFMNADTPPNCPKAYQHRKRMCKEGYERVLARLIQKQTREMNELRASIAQSVDDALLPEKRPESYFQYISGQQYMRKKKELFKEAMEFVRHNGDKIEDNTPCFKEMDTKNETALLYKNSCQNIVDSAMRILQVKHQQQRNQILIEAEDALQKIIREQNQEAGSSELSPTMRRLDLSSSSPNHPQQYQPQQRQPQRHYQPQPQHQQHQRQVPVPAQQHQQHHHHQQQQQRQVQHQQQIPVQQQHHQQRQVQQPYQHQQQRQPSYQHQQTPIIHSTNVSRDPRIRPGYNAPRR